MKRAKTNRVKEFAGIISNEAADELKRNIKEIRKTDTASYEKSLHQIIKALKRK